MPDFDAVDWRLLDQRNEDRFVDFLTQAGVIIKGHFVLASGKHSDTFVNIKGLYPHVRITMLFGRALAVRIEREMGGGLLNARGVVAPAIGGIVFAHDTAYWLSELCQEFDREFLALFAEKSRGSDDFVYGRGYDEMIPGGVFVEVEDVITSGGSVEKVIRLTRDNGGEVLLVCCIWNRGGVETVAGVRVVSLINRALPIWTPEECKANGPCSKEEQIDLKHGRGRQYVQEHGQVGVA